MLVGVGDWTQSVDTPILLAVGCLSLSRHIFSYRAVLSALGPFVFVDTVIPKSPDVEEHRFFCDDNYISLSKKKKKKKMSSMIGRTGAE